MNKKTESPTETYSLVYGMKMLPAAEVDAVEDAPLTLTDGTKTHITMHLIEGTREQVKKMALESIDAFFELHGDGGM
jgi:hypothetical protein